MSRNIEIKAHIESADALVTISQRLSAEPPVEILQDDTFFQCAAGRLKLRSFSNGAGELIFYKRANQSGPKESFYVISPTIEPDSLREALALAYGQVGRVKKRRMLFMAGRTRIHLDRVEGLGDFLELEVVLVEGEALEIGMLEATQLMEKLGVQQHQLIEEAYVDLLAKRAV